MSSVLVRGFVFGFAIAASPGPVFFLCLRRSLVHGRLTGLLSGFGVATVDGFYAAVATLGIAGVLSVLGSARHALAIAGGVLLALVGVSLMVQRPRAVEAAAPTSRGLAWAYVSTVGLTLTNPATILSFAALAASLGRSMPALVVAGVLVGSAAWWTLVALGASWLRPRLGPRTLRGISIFSGVAIVALGGLAVYTAFA